MAELKRVAVVMLPVRTYCRHVLRGVASVSATARWECILIPADPPPPLVDLVDGHVHGLIGHFADAALTEQVIRTKLPAVDVSPPRPEPDLPRVTTDEVAVGRLAAAHLLSLGLPHFGFCGTRGEYSSLLREEGFKQTIQAAGLSCHVYLNNDASGQGATPAVESPVKDAPLEQWVAGLPKPIGVMAHTDGAAMHLLAICRKRRIPVPSSVAVVGVGNDDVFCDLTHPPLSSVALSTVRIGYEAARMLDRLMVGKEPGERQLLVAPAGVVPRQSTELPLILDADVAATVRYIAMHVADRLQVGDLLREIPVSRRSLEVKFRKILGRSPAAEIRRAQIKLAERMLAETDEPLSRVAHAAGFTNAKQLGAIFHRETGKTPTAFRRTFRFV